MCTLVEIEPNKRAYVLRDELTMTSVDWAIQSDPISLTFSLQTLLLISVDHEFLLLTHNIKYKLFFTEKEESTYKYKAN